MSKSLSNTRDKILDRALEMFNERGIEYVGLRELAADLDIRVSNITYYFPTKDDLVYQLSLELGKCNAATIVINESMTMLGFLEMLQQVFKNHLRFRCLMLSFVHLMKQNKLIAASYKHTQKSRYAALSSNLEILAANGFLNIKGREELQFLVPTLALISRFWVSEAAVSFSQWSDKEQMRHYLSLVTKLLLPYSTARAKKDIRVFLDKCW